MDSTLLEEKDIMFLNPSRRLLLAQLVLPFSSKQELQEAMAECYGTPCSPKIPHLDSAITLKLPMNLTVT